MEQVNSIDWKKVGFTTALGLAGYLITKKYISKNNLASVAGLVTGSVVGYLSYDEILK